MNKLTKSSRRWLIASIICIVLLVFFRGLFIRNILSENHIPKLAYYLTEIILTSLLIISVVRLFFIFKEQISNSYKKTKENIRKNNASKTFIYIVITIFAIITFFGTVQILSDTKCASCNVYKVIGFILIMVWTCIFLCYFIWAIYYYNLNLGKTNEEWAKIKEAKNNRSKGLPYNQQDIDEEPRYNPYHDQTFGVPPGTVRGMIAFTLLFGAIAMLIVSFGMSNQIDSGSFFYDQFEFFKTAFLMMIAFYFGSRSLKYLRNGNHGVYKPDNGSTSNNGDDNISTEISSPNDSEIIVINNNIETSQTNDESIPPIVAIDPMAPKK